MITLDGTLGITSPAETVQGALTTTGNTILGDASTDTLNVGNGGLVKDASGNVGIGTASPAVKLDIRGNTNGNILAGVYNDSTAASSQAYMQISAGARYANLTANYTNTYFINAGVGLTTSYQDYDTQIYRNNAGTERMRIDSSGNLLVGTTSALGGKISVVFDGSATNGVRCKTTYATNGSQFVDFLNSGGTQIGYISQNGSTTVSYSTSSDYRLKNTIAPMAGALEKVALLKPVTYKWNADGSDGQGFIAHELQEVVPDCVTGEKDAVDAEGNPVHQGIDTSFLVATLTAAIQEQQALITQLQADVATLKALSA